MNEPARELVEAISRAVNALCLIVDASGDGSVSETAAAVTREALGELRTSKLAFDHARAVGAVSGEENLADLLPLIAEMESLLLAPAQGDPKQLSDLARALCALLLTTR